MLTDMDLQVELIEDMNKPNTLEAKVKTMFFMQNELNSLIDSDWYNHKHWDFQRATMIELGELMDHYGYKWWKKQEPNIEQCKLEVIDILHFHISHLIQTAIRNEQKYDFYTDAFTEELADVEYETTSEAIRKAIDECIFLASSKSFSTKALVLLMNIFGIKAQDLCNQYIVKNTLNIFRASNGYKAGTYKKIWNGKEDNEVLVEIYSNLDKDSVTLADDLYTNLELYYKEVA